MKILDALKTRWVVWVWNHTPDCAEMSRLASQSLERPLPPGLRLRMRLHHLICVWCQRYSRQLKFLHRAAPRLNGGAENSPGQGLSPEAKRRIAQRLRDAG